MLVISLIILEFVNTLGDNMNECGNPDSKCCLSTGSGLEFNLCPLKLTIESQVPYYQTIDTVYNNDSIGYRFTFNIGDHVLEYPSDTCSNHQGAYCNGLSSDQFCPLPLDLINDTFPAKAWAYMEKINETTDEIIQCWDLASTKGAVMAYAASSFLSPMEGNKNYAAGVQVHYQDGDYDKEVNRNRYLSINLICKNTYNGNGIVKEMTVFRSKSWAEYALYFKSLYGCPTLCISGSQLCSGNGVCGYDFTFKKPRCYCFQGFTGDSCDTTDDLISEHETLEHYPIYNNENEYVYTIQTDFVSSSGTPLNVTFDINPMIDEIGEYMKVQNLNEPDTEFYINWLGKMSDHRTMNMSKNAYSKCYDLQNGTGYAFLYNMREENCYLLGRNFGYDLIDETNPAKGWEMKWYNDEDDGDKCGQQGLSLKVPLFCPDTDETTVNPPPFFPYPVQQSDYIGCKWMMPQIISFGCPRDCIQISKSQELLRYSICSLHGVCVLDPYKEDVTCLCDTGYKGDNCSVPIVHHPTSTPTLSPTDSGSNNDDAFITLNKSTFLIVIGSIGMLMLLLIIGFIVCCKLYHDSHKKLDNLGYRRIGTDNIEPISPPNSMDGVGDTEDSNDSEQQLIDTHDTFLPNSV